MFVCNNNKYPKINLVDLSGKLLQNKEEEKKIIYISEGVRESQEHQTHVRVYTSMVVGRKKRLRWLNV